MMTRSKKKCTMEKDKSAPLQEKVMMDHSGTSGGLYCLQTDYCQGTWMMPEKLNGQVDGDKGEFQESRVRSMLDLVASSNILSRDLKMLDHALWRTLPEEILVLVLGRLPFSDITRLRSLSRDWRKELATVNSGINQACDEANSTVVALLSHTATDAFLVTIYDITKCRWQSTYRFRLRRPMSWNYEDWKLSPNTWTPVNACDGGLMCFISLWKPMKDNRLRIAVVNLLTRVQHELPPLHYKYNTMPTMVQIKVDSHTKCYEVVVAMYRAGGFTIEIYDSRTKQWTRAMPPSGFIFGPVLEWMTARGWHLKLATLRPSAYDFGERELVNFTTSNSATRNSMSDTIFVDRALVKDHVFHLMEWTQMDTSLGRRMHLGFHIIEYHFDNQTKAWVEEKLYECPDFADLQAVERSSVSLNACDGFLMVIFHYDQRSECFRLLDLSTGEWSTVPENPNSKRMHTFPSQLCRTFWNVIP